MRRKKFDCVEMKHAAARKIYAATKDMSVQEEVDYWRIRTEEALRWLEDGKKKKRPSGGRKAAAPQVIAK